MSTRSEDSPANSGDVDALRRELQRTRARLFRADRMAALGSMVAGIAHEINTPVGAIVSMQDTLTRAVHRLKATLASEFPDSGNNRQLNSALTALEEACKVIGSGSERVQTLVARLRSFARLDEGDWEPVDLHEGIEDTLALLHNQLKTRIEVRKIFGELPAVQGCGSQLKQVFLNLLVNASQAIADRGVVTIGTALKGDRVEVTISDDGRGIAPEDQERLFEPGFTTKASGTGLGLAICHEIVEHHQGTIRVDSEPGRGTTFTIDLPIAGTGCSSPD